MIHSDIKLSKLNTYTDCSDALDAMEQDYRNFVGGFKAFNSGYKVYFLAAAEKKREAIKKKMQKFSFDE